MRMKTLLHTSLLFLTILLVGNLKAQTSINITYVASTSSTYCPATAAVYFYLDGMATGYNDLIDDIDVTIHWGDGTTDNFVSDLVDISGTDYFDTTSWSDHYHVFAFPGTFSPMFIATGPDYVYP